MLDLASLGTTTHAFAFGGVGFEVVADPGVRWELSPDFARHASALATTPVAASVRCAVRLDPALPDGHTRGVQIERTDSATFVRTAELRAELRPLRAAAYQADARIAPYRPGALAQGSDAVVAGLSAAILEQHAGLTLHAAAIELGGCAVLFLGPSGAGKSTAVRLVEGARVFAFDRVSVGRGSSGGYMAWSLPRGTPVDTPPSASRALAIAGILRVRQGVGQPRISRIEGARALFAVRESTEIGDASMRAEDVRMNAIGALVHAVPIGEIQTVLGAAHRRLLHDFLITHGSSYGCAMKGNDHGEH